MDYLGYVVVFLNLVQENVRHVSKILHILKNVHESVKLSKCELFRTTITYLGHVVKPGKLDIKGCAIKSIEDSLPCAAKEIYTPFSGSAMFISALFIILRLL